MITLFKNCAKALLSPVSVLALLGLALMQQAKAQTAEELLIKAVKDGCVGPIVIMECVPAGPIPPPKGGSPKPPKKPGTPPLPILVPVQPLAQGKVKLNDTYGVLKNGTLSLRSGAMEKASEVGLAEFQGAEGLDSTKTYLWLPRDRKGRLMKEEPFLLFDGKTVLESR
ncbi:MAG: hypothetical protein AAGK38_00050 [Pseudomonadota bacterium]